MSVHEQAALGCMLMDRRAAGNGLFLLAGGDFEHPRHEQIFHAVELLHSRGAPTDPVAVAGELQNRGELVKVGGAVYLHDLIAAVSVPSNLPVYAAQVKRDANYRRLQGVVDRLQQQVREATVEPAELADAAKAWLDLPATSSDAAVSALDLFATAVDRIQSGPVPSTPSPWADLNEKTLGFRPGTVTVVGARPSAGKSVLAQNVAEHASRFGGVLFASMEMSAEEIMLRIIARNSNVSLNRLQTGDLDDRDWDAVGRAREQIRERLIVDDTARQSLSSIRRAAGEVKHRHGLKLICVDYLQLMQPPDPKAPREQQVAAISRGIKLLAKELDVAVVLLSQLNRGSATRQDKRPTMADLRESGSIEQDADVVILIDRGDGDESWRFTQIVAKNRQGPLADLDFEFHGHVSSIR